MTLWVERYLKATILDHASHGLLKVGKPIAWLSVTVFTGADLLAPLCGGMNAKAAV